MLPSPKAVLATQFTNFDKGPTLISQLSSLLGTGVFNSDGVSNVTSYTTRLFIKFDLQARCGSAFSSFQSFP